MSAQDSFKFVSDESHPDNTPPARKKTKRPSHWRFFTELELLVLKCVKRELISAQEIANLMEIENNSTLRATLSSMTERMIIIRAKGGYRINR